MPQPFQTAILDAPLPCPQCGKSTDSVYRTIIGPGHYKLYYIHEENAKACIITDRVTPTIATSDTQTQLAETTTASGQTSSSLWNLRFWMPGVIYQIHI